MGQKMGQPGMAAKPHGYRVCRILTDLVKNQKWDRVFLKKA